MEIQDANFSTELRAGLTTFATMSYIIAVNVGTSLALSRAERRLIVSGKHPQPNRSNLHLRTALGQSRPL
jgi:xanthine/uracil/vitamin C permease (AzgA family)